MRWIRDTGFPIIVDGQVTRGGGIAQDVTELKRAEQRQAMLLTELQHRVRNILAMVRSVTRRTAEGAETVTDYWQHLEGRLTAMARTQALLTRTFAAGVDLQNFILDELVAHGAEPARAAVSGPDIRLPSMSAEMLSLAVHELVTNSVKYGALAGTDGRIDIRWALLEGDDAPRLSFIWCETGLSLPAPIEHSGFGREFITEQVPSQLGGMATMEFTTSELIATIEFPVGQPV